MSGLYDIPIRVQRFVIVEGTQQPGQVPDRIIIASAISESDRRFRINSHVENTHCRPALREFDLFKLSASAA